MNISSGTIGFRTQIQVKCRAFLIPWVEKKTVITCSNKNRDYSSASAPVRYIPKKSQSLSSEKVKVSKRKDLSGFSEAAPPLENEVPYGGNFVRKGFDFDCKTRNGRQMPARNVHYDDIEQDDAMEEPEDVSEGDIVVEETDELRIRRLRNSPCDGDVFQPLENKAKIISRKLPEKLLSTSQGGNDEHKSFSLDVKAQYEGQVLTGNLLFNDDEQDTILEEPEEVSADDDILEEELGEDFNVRQHNIYRKEDMLKHGEDKTTHDVRKAAAKLLARRAFTTVELQKKLCGKGFSADIVEGVMSDFQSRGLLNDGWFAEAFCQSKWSSSTWGPRRIKQELSRKGVSKVDMEKAIDAVFRDGESDEYRESREGLSKASMDRLFTQASKQWLRGNDVPKETRKSRIIRWLLYRGFSWDVIGIIVKKLESNDRP